MPDVSAQERPFASVVVPLPACRHAAYQCTAERRGDDHVLVCPCGHVRVCEGDIDAMVWAHVYSAGLARKIRDEKNAVPQRPSAIYVWLVPSEEVLEQPGSWRIRKWDTEPFPEANFALSESESSLIAVEFTTDAAKKE